jgi:hypothetical protein
MGLAPLMLDLLWVFAFIVGIAASIVTAFVMQAIYREKLGVRLLDVCVGLLAALCGNISSTVLRFQQPPAALGWVAALFFSTGFIAAVASVSVVCAVREYLKLQRRRSTT